MSLKVVHLLFIVLAIGMLCGFALWSLREGQYVSIGAVSGVLGLALFIYGIFFLRKWKSLK